MCIGAFSREQGVLTNTASKKFSYISVDNIFPRNYIHITSYGFHAVLSTTSPMRIEHLVADRLNSVNENSAPNSLFLKIMQILVNNNLVQKSRDTISLSSRIVKL